MLDAAKICMCSTNHLTCKAPRLPITALSTLAGIAAHVNKGRWNKVM